MASLFLSLTGLVDWFAEHDANPLGFASYILDDHSGMFFTGHLDGGSYIDLAEKQAMATAGKKTD